MYFKTRLLFSCFLLLFNLPLTSVGSHHLWWKQIHVNTGINTQNKTTAAVQTVRTLIEVMRFFLPLITNKHASTFLPKYFHLILFLSLRSKSRMLSWWCKVGERGTGGIKRHTGGSGWISGGAPLGAATQGWRFLGRNPQSTQPCAATDPSSEAPTTPVTLLGYELATTCLPPHDFTSQSETTFSCQAVMFMLSPAVCSSLKTQVRLIALVICSFPQLSYH